MKKITIILILSVFSIELLAQRDIITRRRDLLLMRSLMQRVGENSEKDQLNGKGVVFQSQLRIEKLTKKIKEGKKTKIVEKKIYKAFIRGCGVIELSRKSDDFLKERKNGERIKIRLTGERKCKVADWSLF